MPTVRKKDGFRFYFYSNESDEPVHIHEEKGAADGKIWLMPKIELAYKHGFNSSEVKQIAVIVFEYCEQFIKRWNEHFDK